MGFEFIPRSEPGLGVDERNSEQNFRHRNFFFLHLQREKKEKEKGNLIDRERKQRHRGGEGLLRVLVRSKKK